MKERLFSFVVLWSLAILVPWWLDNLGVALLVAVFAFLTQREIYDLLGRIGAQASTGYGLAAGVLVSLGSYFAPLVNLDLATVFAGAVVLVVIAFLFQPLNSRLFRGIGATVFGITLGPLMLSFIMQIVLLGDFALGLWVIGAAKFADVGGLLVGMAIGRHKLAPNLSPNKTWEGVIGGVCFSILFGGLTVLFLPQFFPENLTPWLAALIALPVAVAGISADLFESALKREAKTKDAGNLFPGIGGAFDLTDSLLLAAPVGYLCLRPLLG